MLGLGLAQISSYLVDRFIEQERSIIMNGFLHLTHVRNLGGIFGIFQGKGWIFAAVSILFLAGLVVYVCKDKTLMKFEYYCYAAIVGGGLSNIVDRLIYGSVIDFIDIQGIPYWNYIFNIADVMIHIGIWPLVMFSLFKAKNARGSTAEENPA